MVFLGVGTNIGDRARNIEQAIERIGAFARIEGTSSIYETEPIGYADQPEFWNLVVVVSTDLPAAGLMRELIAVEHAMGRERTFPNAPRIIDLDILLYDDVVFAHTDLVIPHPRMHERAFVLQPLLEVAPNVSDPRTRRPFADALSLLPAARVTPIAPPLRVMNEKN